MLAPSDEADGDGDEVMVEQNDKRKGKHAGFAYDARDYNPEAASRGMSRAERRAARAARAMDTSN